VLVIGNALERDPEIIHAIAEKAYDTVKRQ
jgi:hypothetical protein